MKSKICLHKKFIYSYIAIATLLLYGTIYNLIHVINGGGSALFLGLFVVTGVVLLPIVIRNTYYQNLCNFQTTSIIIGHEQYAYQEYYFYIETCKLELSKRPIISFYQKEYKKLTIKRRSNNHLEASYKLALFEDDMKCLRKNIPIE